MRIAFEINLMQTWLFELLRCPITQQTLLPAEPDIVEELQRVQKAGQLYSRIGLQVTEEIRAGLRNQAGNWFYRVASGIPTLIPDEAIALTQKLKPAGSESEKCQAASDSQRR